MSQTIRVQREGGRGHHLIDQAKYDANPKAYVRVDDLGYPIDAEPPARVAPMSGSGSGDGRFSTVGNGGSAGSDLEGKTVPELRALAADRNIDLGDATKKADIIAAIEAAAEA